MLRTALFIAGHDVRHMLREKETLLWLFVMPLVFMYFIGSASGGISGPDTKDELALVAPADAGFLADRLVRRLEENDYRVERCATAAEAEGKKRVLELPAGFSERVAAGEKSPLVLTRDGEGRGADYDRVRVARAVYTTLADVVACAKDPGGLSPEALERLDALPRTLTIESRSAGQRLLPPTGFEQSVPGVLVMFTLIALLTSGAVLLVIERRAGLLRRLSYTPLPRSGIVLGKWLGKLALGLTQVSFAMLAGTLLFGIDWGSALPMVILVLLAWACFCSSAGLLLGSLARTESQAVGVGVLTTNVLAALGGCWWPIEVAPRWMQSLARLLPTGWAMDAMHGLLSFRAAPATAIPNVLALLVGATLLGLLARRSFRFA